MELFSFLEPKGGQQPVGLHQQQHQSHQLPPYPLGQDDHPLSQQSYEPLQHHHQRPRQEQQQTGEGITFNFNRRRLAGRGGDVEVRVWLTFEESVRGCIRELRFRALVPCGACRGRGLLSLLEAGLVRSREELTPCAHCHGTGTYSRRSALLTINSTCCHCNGHGYPLDQPCVQCSHGRLSDEKVLQIEVPQGVMHDMRMVYSGQGDAGEFGGESGDLVVVFGVEESSLFQRDGDDVLSEVNVNYFEAALGATVLIRGIYGNEIPLQIPPGTQPDDMLCLKGEGFLSVCPAPAAPGQEGSSLHPSSSAGEVESIPRSSDVGASQQQQPAEQPAFPHYQYRRRRRRSSYQPPPDNGERPAYRTINRTDYFNSLLQKSNFFSSTFLQQGLSSPFSLFKEEAGTDSSPSSSFSSSSSSSTPSSQLSTASSIGSAAQTALPRVGTGVSSQWQPGADRSSGTEGDLVESDAGSGTTAHPSPLAGRESSVGLEEGHQHAHPAPAAGTGDNGDSHEQRRRNQKRPRPETNSDIGGDDDNDEGFGEVAGPGMAKEAEEEEEEEEQQQEEREPRAAQQEQIVNGYSLEAEAVRRVVGSAASADTEDAGEDKALEVRHTLVHTECSRPPPFDETPHKAKEEERGEHSDLDAIDIDTAAPLDDVTLAVADGVLADLPRAPLLPRHRPQATTTPPPGLVSPSSPAMARQQRRGDMYIRVKVGVPQALSPYQSHLLAALKKQWMTLATAGERS